MRKRNPPVKEALLPQQFELHKDPKKQRSRSDSKRKHRPKSLAMGSSDYEHFLHSQHNEERNSRRMQKAKSMANLTTKKRKSSGSSSQIKRNPSANFEFYPNEADLIRALEASSEESDFI